MQNISPVYALLCKCSTSTGLAPSHVQTWGDAFIRQAYLGVSVSISQSSLCPFLCDRKDINQLPSKLNGCGLVM